MRKPRVLHRIRNTDLLGIKNQEFLNQVPTLLAHHGQCNWSAPTDPPDSLGSRVLQTKGTSSNNSGTSQRGQRLTKILYSK